MVQIIYKYNDQDEAKALTTIVEHKLEMLQKFIDDGATVLCEVEFEKVAPQKSGNVFRMEANVTIDGTLYRADAVEESFEKAIDEVRSELDKELRRAKGKQTTLFRRASRKIKERFLGG